MNLRIFFLKYTKVSAIFNFIVKAVVLFNNIGGKKWFFFQKKYFALKKGMFSALLVV